MISLLKRITHYERKRQVQITNEQKGLTLVIQELRIPPGKDEEECVCEVIEVMPSPEFAFDCEWFGSSNGRTNKSECAGSNPTRTASGWLAAPLK